MPIENVLIAGVPLILVIPACVEVLKRAGLADRYAGVAAIVCGILLLALGDLAVENSGHWSTWVVGGVVYGLAAAGLYSQRHVLGENTSKTAAKRT